MAMDKYQEFAEAYMVLAQVKERRRALELEYQECQARFSSALLELKCGGALPGGSCSASSFSKKLVVS